MRSRSGGRLLSAVLASAMTSGLLVVGAVTGAAPALAVQPAQDTLVSDNPADFTPHVLDGIVRAVAVVGDTIVLGGEFTQAQDDFGGPVLNRKNILAFDRTTGLISDTFVPRVDDVVRTLAPAPDGQSVFVGGKFGSVNGTPTFKLAKLDVTTGAKVAGFDPGVVSALVYDIKLFEDRLFIAGGFDTVAGQSRSMLAELDPTTGELRPSVWPVFAGTRQPTGGNRLDTSIQKIDINPDGQTLVAVGNFLTVGDQPQQQIAMVNITSDTSLTGWRTTKFEATCVTGVEYYVNDVEFSPDGDYFIVATGGGYGSPPKLCDTLTRWESDRRNPDLSPTWAAYNGGDSNYAIAVTGTAIYVGGHERWWNNPSGNNLEGPGAVTREGIAALDPVNGLPLSWNPSRDRGRGVFDMIATDDGLWVGSDTDRIGDFEYHGRIAFFPLAGGKTVPRPTPPPLPVDAYVVNGTISEGSFDGDVAAPTTPATIDGVTPTTINGGFWLDGYLYLALTDGTLTVRRYDGEFTGPATTIDLHGLTEFSTEITRMRGLFYVDGSIIFTLSGDSKLYRRAFTPESNVVGATRTTIQTGGVNWSNQRGMFFADRGLYYANKGGNGDLHRIAFGTKGPKPGTDTIVSGPSTDGRNWKGRAMFTLSPPPPNQAPTAAFTVSCVGPTCTFDATDSVDSDGQLTDYTWDFGDTTTGSGVQTEHTYDQPGDYTVTLTVTDNDLGTGSTTRTASVVVSEISFVGSARHADDTTKTTQSVTLSADIQAGDQLVMTESYNAGTGNNPPVTVSDPAGWVRVAQTSTTALTTVVWTQTAAGGLGGTTVTTTTSGLVRSSLLVSAYRDAVIQPGGVALVGETTSRADHTTPVLPAPDGSWVLSSWEDKTATTTMWAVPDSEVVRQTGTQAGTRVSWLLTDTGGPVPAGDVGGKTAVAQTATGDSVTGNATMLTVVLAPAP